MFFGPACIPCIVKQATAASLRFAPDDEALQYKIIRETCSALSLADDSITAPGFSVILQDILVKNTGLPDPYYYVKRRNLQNAQYYIPLLREIIRNSSDKLETAVRASIIGNAIDLSANPGFDITAEISRMNEDSITLPSYKRFREEVGDAGIILYIGDNFEEALFDKLLIEALHPRRVVFAVRSSPVTNDITLRDAVEINLPDLCEVVESGSRIAGTDISQCSAEFMELYQNADIVIAKGQGNYESMIYETRPVYFLFRVKCDVIAARSGFGKGMGVMILNQSDK